MTNENAIDGQGEPYPGLRAFRRDETHIFFGRESAVTDMVDRMASHRFLAVTGHSGSGKSSLVRVGLLDALERGLLVEAGSNWCVVDFAPGGQPFSRLTAALVRAVGRDFSEQELGLIEAKLTRGPLSLVAWLDEIEFNSDSNVLLLVDQFEEIFRYRQGQAGDDIDAFVALLLASAKQRYRRMYVVITMRSDFLGDCARFTGLAEQINDGQFLTPRMSRDQCREAIEGPAGVYGGRVEPALVTRMLNDMAGNPDQLPLMQHLLMLLWQEARKRSNDALELTLADYESLGGIGSGEWDTSGGVEARKSSFLQGLFGRLGGSRSTDAARQRNGALSDHADRVLAELSPERQRLARSLFRALTQSDGSGGRAVRRPVRLEQAVAITEAPAGELIRVIEAFRAPGRSFLTPLAPIPVTPQTIIDISHESLIRQWGNLRQWVQEEHQSAEAYRYVERSAKQWKRGLGNLLAKVDLAVARKWLKAERPTAAWAQRYGDGYELAMSFLRKSERHRVWRRGIIATSATAVLLVVLLATTVAMTMMAVVTTGLAYVNPADEWSDFAVNPQTEMKRDVGTDTPRAVPGGRVIGTGELERAINLGKLEEVPFLTIDVLRRSAGAKYVQYIPKSIYIEFAGDYGTFNDNVQMQLKAKLSELTTSNLEMPLVFFCAGTRCWESYNASLRAVNLGYTKVYWYRGGISSWQAAHQPYVLDFNLIPISVSASLEKGVGVLYALKQRFWPSADYDQSSGMDYVRRKQYDYAIDALNRAIKLDPKNAQAYYGRAIARDGKLDSERAIADYDKAIELNPKLAHEINPKYALALNNRGWAYQGKGDLVRALADFSKALEIEPNNPSFVSNRGFVRLKAGEYDLAIADYGRAIQIDARRSLDYYHRGWAYQSKGDYGKAVADYSRAIDIEPRRADFMASRGYARFYIGDFKEAAVDLQRAGELQDSVYLILYRYVTRMRAGMPAAAELEVDARRVTDKRWPYAAIELFAGKRSPQDALQAAANPNDVCEAHFFIGEWHLLRDDKGAAANALQRAADTCPHAFFEYTAALAELKRIAPAN